MVQLPGTGWSVGFTGMGSSPARSAVCTDGCGCRPVGSGLVILRDWVLAQISTWRARAVSLLSFIVLWLAAVHWWPCLVGWVCWGLKKMVITEGSRKKGEKRNDD